MLRDREAAQLVRGIPELPLPRSVQGLVASRLDLVSDDERAVLHAASVLGDSCWPSPVGAAGRAARARRSRSAWPSWPGAECCAGCGPRACPGEPEYVFRSALVRELVYARLPRPRRLQQHVRAADWWATRPSGRDSERAELVAHHRVIASELASALRAPEAALRAEQARLALREAAERSYVLRALLPTRAHLDRALALWDPDVDPVGRQSCLRLAEEVRFLADRDSYVKEGGPQRVAAVAEALSALGADAEAARAHTLLGQVAWWVADRTEALGSARPGRRAARRTCRRVSSRRWRSPSWPGCRCCASRPRTRSDRPRWRSRSPSGSGCTRPSPTRCARSGSRATSSGDRRRDRRPGDRRSSWPGASSSPRSPASPTTWRPPCRRRASCAAATR